MNNNELLNLGWGIVGTPKGRQYSAQGIHDQLELDNIFDLPQEFGSCLPDPREETARDCQLYYFTYRQDKKIIGIAEYRSIFEQGQTRQGSYFGAFIETSGYQFSAGDEEIKAILSGLIELNNFQINNFIDKNTKSYKEIITNKDFNYPLDELKIIGKGLTPLNNNPFSQSRNNENVIFIHIINPTETITVIKNILQHKLYFNYPHIYFSFSQNIINKMNNKNYTIINSEQLYSRKIFTKVYEKESDFLRKKCSDLTQNINYLKEIIEKLKKDMDSKIQKGISQEKERLAEKEALIKQKETYLAQEEIFSWIGKEVTLNIQDKINTISNKEGIKQATLQDLLKRVDITGIQTANNEIENKINNLQEIIKNLHSPIILPPKTSLFSHISILLTLLLLIIILILQYFSYSSDENENISKMKNSIENTIEKNTEDLNDQINEIKKLIKDKNNRQGIKK
ncbi:hypothetical protein ACFFHT_07235 [Gallibacterium melopsittaci]|uniref:Uncharacterized protein n=1 Tax=Gallibacterium melopsittaci TaxID=516063 RepID=A0ABV6HWU3_9PAST